MSGARCPIYSAGYLETDTSAAPPVCASPSATPSNPNWSGTPTPSITRSVQPSGPVTPCCCGQGGLFCESQIYFNVLEGLSGWRAGSNVGGNAAFPARSDEEDWTSGGKGVFYALDVPEGATELVISTCRFADFDTTITVLPPGCE